jgi:ParB/RepB/Spo0J family partition protein
MRVEQVDPYNVNVDEMNERKENLNLSELEESVAEQGVIQPPIVRKRNGNKEVDYTVVVGQRRTLASQGAGLNEIPVVVMGFDDADALEASITENVEAFNENVSRKDRAFAIQRLKEMKNWNNKQVASSLGVHERRISEWLEYTRDEWEGTAIDPEFDADDDDVINFSKKIDDLSPDIVSQVRNVTGGGGEGEELLKKAVEHDLNKDDVRELAKKVERGKDMDSALAQTIEEKHDTGDIKVKANVTFSGEYAGALTNYAQDRGMTENEVVREAIQNYLNTEGYL